MLQMQNSSAGTIRALGIFSNGQPRLAAAHRKAVAQASEQRHPLPQLHNLIVVAAHAVFIGHDYSRAEDMASWQLLSYQREVPGQAASFVHHMQLGIEAAAADQRALLLFSGGHTRKAAGPRSEAEGYWMVAEAAGWWGRPEVRERAFTEEHARDSFENLLFSLCRFFELTGHHPSSLAVVSYDFKRARMLEEHRRALRWPAERMTFLGSPTLTADAVQAESRTLEAFQHDPYGCSGELQHKKDERDPFALGPYSAGRCPAMSGLLEWCSPDIFAGPVPWD